MDKSGFTARRVLHIAVGCAVLAAATGAPAIAATEPVPGSTFVYVMVNGYSKEPRGQLHYHVDKVDAGSYTVSVSPDKAAAGEARTEIYTKEGNGLRHQMESHGQKVEYQFAAAYPAYVFPLEAGKSWSVRVNATVPGTTRVRSVRVDGTVLGRERIRVPAGEFDTVKVRRVVYPGDATHFLPETRILEFDWYTPALGRAVRTERTSQFIDFSRCDHRASCDYYGDWDVYELVSMGAAGK